MQTNKILRGAILAGLFILPFIFFSVPASLFFPFITGKNFEFRILVEIIACLWVVLALRDAAYRPRRTWIFYACALFLAVIAIADIFGVNFSRSFWSNYERMEGLVTHLHLFLLFLVAGAMLTSEKLWSAFWKTSIASSVLMSFYAIAQLLGLFAIDQGTTRVDGKFGNATYLAVYVLFHIFLILFLLVRERSAKLQRWLLAAALVLELIVLYYTATRGDILGLAVGLGLAALLVAIRGREDATVRKWSYGVLATLVFFGGGFLLIRNTAFVARSPVLARFASISPTERTTESRVLIWKLAWKGFKEHPILGWGQENFNVVFNKYYDPKLYNQEAWFDRTHNVVLDWAIAGGALGLLAYLSIFVAAILALYRSRRFSFAEKAIFVGLLAAYFFQNLFVFDNLGSYVMFFALLAYFSFEESDIAPASSAALSEGVQTAGAIAAVVVFGCALYFLNVPAIRANTTLIQALIDKNNPAQDLKDFQKAVSFGTFGNNEIREQFLQAAQGVVGATGISDDIKQQFASSAAEQMIQQTKDAPEDARPELFLGSFFDRIGQSDLALPHVTRAHELSPGKQAILFELAVTYLSSNDTAKALAVAKQAFESAPDYNEARSVYATVALYAGMNDLADSLLKDHTDLFLDDTRLLQAYVALKRFDKVIEIWQVRLAANPNDPQAHLSYAAALAEGGKDSAAIGEIQKAVELENASGDDAATKAKFQTDAAGYIAQIKAGTFK